MLLMCYTVKFKGAVTRISLVQTKTLSVFVCFLCSFVFVTKRDRFTFCKDRLCINLSTGTCKFTSETRILETI